MNKEIDTTLENLGTIALYNGWYETLQEIKKYIEQEMERNKDSEYYTIGKPTLLKEFDVDMFPNIIWSILVLQCGDYGISTRFGWIESTRVKDAIEIIDALCAETELCNSYKL